jgi:hypothetical protein
MLAAAFIAARYGVAAETQIAGKHQPTPPMPVPMA